MRCDELDISEICKSCVRDLSSFYFLNPARVTCVGIRICIITKHLYLQI